jgi:phage terminase large subunit
MPTLNPSLRDFWKTPARYRVLFGGRASSKTWDAAGMAVFLAQRYTARFLCTRQFQNNIAESVYEIIEYRAFEFGLGKEFIWQKRTIVHKRTGSEFIFYGIARNINEIKSTEGVDIAWHEECELLSEEQFKVIDPTLRKQGSQHWFIFNPRFATDFAYQRLVVNPLKNSIVRHINYEENPFLSKTALEVIDAMKEEDPDLYEHVYHGVPLNDDNKVVIKSTWVEAAIDAHIKLGFEPEGSNVIGFDVADDGNDLCANVHAHGSVVLWADEWKGLEDELLKSCSRTYQAARQRESRIRYDCIGVGASAGAKFDELNEDNDKKIRYSKFNAGGSVHKPEEYYVQDKFDKIKNKDFFSNIKAQVWWSVADRFRNTYNAVIRGEKHKPEDMISISSACPHLNKLKIELATPFRDFDRNGRVKVESKDDLAKRDIKSPNLADAFVMCFAPNEFGQVKVSKKLIDKLTKR